MKHEVVFLCCMCSQAQRSHIHQANNSHFTSPRESCDACLLIHLTRNKEENQWGESWRTGPWLHSLHTLYMTPNSFSLTETKHVTACTEKSTSFKTVISSTFTATVMVLRRQHHLETCNLKGNMSWMGEEMSQKKEKRGLCAVNH